MLPDHPECGFLWDSLHLLLQPNTSFHMTWLSSPNPHNNQNVFSLILSPKQLHDFSLAWRNCFIPMPQPIIHISPSFSPAVINHNNSHVPHLNLSHTNHAPSSSSSTSLSPKPSDTSRLHELAEAQAELAAAQSQQAGATPQTNMHTNDTTPPTDTQILQDRQTKAEQLVAAAAAAATAAVLPDSPSSPPPLIGTMPPPPTSLKPTTTGIAEDEESGDEEGDENMQPEQEYPHPPASRPPSPPARNPVKICPVEPDTPLFLKEIIRAFLAHGNTHLLTYLHNNIILQIKVRHLVFTPYTCNMFILIHCSHSILSSPCLFVSILSL